MEALDQEKANPLLNLVKQQDDIDKIFSLNQSMIKKRKDAGIKHLNHQSAFVEHSGSIDDIYNNIDDCLMV